MVIPVGMIVPIQVGMLAIIGRAIPVWIPRTIAPITPVRVMVTEAIMRIIGWVVVTVVRALRTA